MVLAAGRGERMRPLTDHCPKPLLEVQGKPLMQWSLEALARGGFQRAVVNTAWLGPQIEDHFGACLHLSPAYNLRELLSNTEQTQAPNPRPSLQISYSHEGRDFGGALETAGGIARALPQLCQPSPRSNAADAFWVLAGDVFAPDFAFSTAAVSRFLASGLLAHLWLVPNPEHNPGGDFGLDAAAGQGIGLALNLPKDDTQPRYTYSTIGLYRAALFTPPWCDIAPGNPLGVRAALAPLLRAAMERQQISAELYTGRWTDVGTPQRLAQLNSHS